MLFISHFWVVLLESQPEMKTWCRTSDRSKHFPEGMWVNLCRFWKTRGGKGSLKFGLGFPQRAIQAHIRPWMSVFLALLLLRHCVLLVCQVQYTQIEGQYLPLQTFSLVLTPAKGNASFPVLRKLCFSLIHSHSISSPWLIFSVLRLTFLPASFLPPKL